MRKLIAILITITAHADVVFAESIKPITVKNPVDYMLTDHDGPKDEAILVMKRDFNCDSLDDLAFSFQSAWGKSGRNWFIFLSNHNGSFTAVGSIFFYGDYISVEPFSRGFRVYWWRRKDLKEIGKLMS